MRRLAALAGLLIAVGLPAAASAQERVEFEIKGQAVTAAVPEGYCLNPAQAKMVTDLIAKSVPDIEIALLLLPCSSQSPQAVDYFAVALPRNDESLDMDRKALLDLMRAELAESREAVNREANRGARETGEEMSQALGTPIEVQPSLHFDAVDDSCVLVSGRLKGAASGLGLAIDKNVGGCMSTIGGRFFIVYRYSNADTGVPVTQLKAEARTLGISIALKDD